MLALLALAGCASPKGAPVRLEGIETLPQREALALVGSNDLHGDLTGLPDLAAQVAALRSERPDHVLWLDSGDALAGSPEAPEARVTEGATAVAALNASGLDAIAVGDGDLNLGLAALSARTRDSRFPWLAANLVERATGISPPQLKLATSASFQRGKLKIGVIGLTTPAAYRALRPDLATTLQIADLKLATLHEAQKLRAEGAQIVILLAHSGLECEAGRAAAMGPMRKPTDPQGECGPLPPPVARKARAGLVSNSVEASGSEIVQLLRQLPAGTVDAVVAGHSHQLAHHWVSGTPVIQAGAYGRFFNIVYLIWDWEQSKLVTDGTRIEGPIAVSARLHGRALAPSSPVQAAIEASRKQAQPALERQISARALPRTLELRSGAETELGDLVADAARQAAGSDVAFVNPGIIRGSLPAGIVRFADVYRVIPFENTVVRLKMSGRELKLWLRVAQSGARGYYPVSGLNLKVIHPDSDAPSSDLDGDGRIAPWEVNRLLEARTSDGKLIEDARVYTVATVDYLARGGDDLAWPASQLSAASRQSLNASQADAPSLRDALEKAIAAWDGRSLTEPPRLTLVKPAVEKGRKGRKVKRRHGKASKGRASTGSKRRHRF